MQFEDFLKFNPSTLHHAVLLSSQQLEQHEFSNEYLRKLAQNFCQISAFTQNTHPDLLIIDRERKTLRLEDVQKIKDFCLFPPQLGSRRLIFIDRCERLNLNSANFLLKLLEEPSANVLFILTTAKTHKVLPTILSRLQKLHIVFSEFAKSNVLDEFEAEDSNFVENTIFNLSTTAVFNGKSLSDKRTFSSNSAYLQRLIEHSEILAKKYSPAQLQAIILYWISERLKKDRTFVIIARFIVAHVRNWKRYEPLNPTSQLWLLRIFLGQQTYENSRHSP